MAGTTELLTFEGARECLCVVVVFFIWGITNYLAVVGKRGKRIFESKNVITNMCETTGSGVHSSLRFAGSHLNLQQGVGSSGQYLAAILSNRYLSLHICMLSICLNITCSFA